MVGAVTFLPSSHTGTNTVIYVGDFSVNNLTVTGSGLTITLTATGLADLNSKLNSIAAGRPETVKG